AGKCKACATDSECGPGGSCQAGACKRATKCSKDEDCADDEDCVNGLCRKPGEASNPGDATCPLQAVYFGFDDSSVQASERDRLAANVSCIETTKGKGVYLIGHTDTSGTDEYNIALSERRAQAVADYMSRLGSDPARLQVVPKGETEPTGLGDDRDRRVEFQWH
ncbi:MAG: OmpA family protein, partial [Myxococcales bacterium]|nr:OmpA family protein [Myxococcales bacterium]